MRLKTIKLAGFKSFADPTAFEVPGRLVGVVGPNGCGKSNVMDAVRWVLGESKASELRGESMQDVIFNGSSERKPSGRSSVELVFDNSLGRIGGSWSGFAEIAVKRVLTRDGQSTYLINNQVVRRRDVHDIFLGTGLGPRAYAMIGQGMISRIIEARPEELRVFLEEAAGVSKYKERRRETENRLSDTRENLTRVEDILRELNGQIDKLETQAEVARQFRELETDRDRKQRLLWLLRRDEALADQQRVSAQIAAASAALEERVAAQRALENELETLRSSHYAAGDEVHAAQARYYETNAEVTRLEAEIRRVAESTQQMRERIAQLEAQQAQAVRDRDEGQAAREQAVERLAVSQRRAQALGVQVEEATAALPQVEARLRDARARVDAARAEETATRQQIELAATRQRAAQANLASATRRRERLDEELSQLRAPAGDELEQVQAKLAEAERAEHATLAGQQAAEGEWTAADAARAPAQQELRNADARFAQIEARIIALRQLQERVETEHKVAPWLERHGLGRLRRLWQRLHIDDGWETAVEAVLRERVAALEVARIDQIAGLISDAPPAKVAFYAPTPAGPLPAPPGLRPLVSVVRCGDAGVQSQVAEWLAGCFVADGVEAAMARRSELPAGAQFVVREGHAVSRASVHLYAPDSEADGVLARQHELENLERERQAQRLLADDARQRAARVEAAAAEAMNRLTQLRERHTAAVRSLATVRLDAQRIAQERELASASKDRLQAELAELLTHTTELEQAVATEAGLFERHDAELGERQERVEALRTAAEQADAELASRREALRTLEREAQEATFESRSVQTTIETLDGRIERSLHLAQQATEERDAVAARLASVSDEPARQGLQAAIDARVSAEQALAAARQRLDDLTQTLRQREEARLGAERDQEPLRTKLVECQLKEQAARLAAEQFAAQLAEFEVDEAALRAAHPETPKPSWLQGEVTRLANAIAALGAVNLAALDELTAARDRKGFLDAQLADLTEAIETLEDAIRKIDRETRQLLQDTYDTVNSHFGRLFPELFGGGEARLILTGDEILDSGIQVMAHPPGKRNSSIHLLSGGEKALTAIALVFSMFQLNPAPFCLLDEVDAPLDDANTVRYCDMVRRMSDQTQFVFITHNKIAMELAEQLIGVTMQERGVSRIVAVDLDAAAQMAEAA